MPTSSLPDRWKLWKRVENIVCSFSSPLLVLAGPSVPLKNPCTAPRICLRSPSRTLSRSRWGSRKSSIHVFFFFFFPLYPRCFLVPLRTRSIGSSSGAAEREERRGRSLVSFALEQKTDREEENLLRVVIWSLLLPSSTCSEAFPPCSLLDITLRVLSFFFFFQEHPGLWAAHRSTVTHSHIQTLITVILNIHTRMSTYSTRRLESNSVIRWSGLSQNFN